jgi:site-specific DNA-methyltransferase (cytosine-N4-specific)
MLSGVLQDPLHREDWDFRDADTKQGTHVVHTYPAMMIPQVAEKLIARLAARRPGSSTLFDPFCGAGTVLVEAARQGLSAVGNDLNPLALKIARVRTAAIEPDRLWPAVEALIDGAAPARAASWTGEPPDFRGRDFWFKPEVVRGLGYLRQIIGATVDDAVRELAEVAFSETVRLTSNTRNGEFKLYRMSPEKLREFHPDTLGIFVKILRRYAQGVADAYHWLKRPAAPVRVVAGDARSLVGVPDAHFDIMVTSPPYGDSRTTVAYGQFSRLAMEWLGVSPREARTVDKRLLGGAVQRGDAAVLSSAAARRGIGDIARDNPARADEVAQFYRDLDKVIAAVAQKLKPGGMAAWVVANRTVKGVTLPTDVIVRELSFAHGFAFVESLTRNIPLKRMPLKNSPSNQAGVTAPTMTQEHIVLLQYQS